MRPYIAEEVGHYMALSYTQYVLSSRGQHLNTDQAELSGKLPSAKQPCMRHT